MTHLSLSVFLSRILFLAAIFTSFASFAQRQKQAVKQRIGSSIIDDTTRNVYGPATTRWTTERELFEDRPNYRPLDTTIHNYQRWTYIQRFNNYYKDLGPMGTAMSSIFPLVPLSIGASSGFEAYAPYYNTEEPKYFDTKSPYTRMYVLWGGNGRAMTRVEFSRNINPRWNFGFNYRPILVEKQIQRRQKGDYQTISQYYDFYTTYRSKDSAYFLLFNYRRIRHRVKENGGVYNPTHLTENLFGDNATPNLLSAESEDYRRNVHVFQRYQLVEAFQIYHIADFSKQLNAFRDVPANDPNTLFETTYGGSPFNPASRNDVNRKDTVNITDETTQITTQQEFGIKGNASKFFYSAYYKIRTYNYSNPLLVGEFTPLVSTSGTESYLGGTIVLKIDSVTQFRGAAETMFLEGYYRLEAEINSPWLEGSFKSSLSKPGFMEQAYRGLHDYWNQKFDKISSTEAKAYLKWKGKRTQLWAGGAFTLFNHLVYFKQTSTDTTLAIQTARPFQSTGTQSTFSPEFKATVNFFRHFYFRPQYIYTQLLFNDQNVLQIPTHFLNAQLTYENSLFKDHLQLQMGVDFHWRSEYYSLAYSPVIQQYYIQDSAHKILNPDFPLADVFFTGKMRRARFFVKYHNIGQTLLGKGYFITPGYPGTGSMVDFGFDFLLFD